MIGAPHRWVTRSRSISATIASTRTERRHTLVPPISAIVHAKHQPLQWNIGSVHK